MDSMLYIIAGLVVIILLAVLLLRRKKAQKPPTQRINRAEKTAAASTPVRKQPIASSNPEPEQTKQSASQFDPITIAQRFIDQQRYDKAIETLNRSLKTQPHDAKLLLKLLNIYAVTNQHEDFYTTYEAIQPSADPAILNEADQLKSLLDQEQIQNVPVQPEESSTDIDSIDFDLPVAQRTPVPTTQPSHDLDNLEGTNDLETSHDLSDLEALDLNTLSETVEAPQETLEHNSDDDTFALTLDDLEVDSLDTDTIETSAFDIDALETSHDNANEDTGHTSDAKDAANEPADTVENIDSDFALDFNFPTENERAVEAASQDDKQDTHSADNLTLEEDFVLDLDDLTAEVSDSDVEGAAVQDNDTDNNEDFALLLEDIEESKEDNTASDLSIETEDTSSVLGMGVADTVAQLDELDFDELSFDDGSFDTAADLPSTPDSAAIKNDVSESDDRILIDDDFDFDALVSSPSTEAPVVSEDDAEGDSHSDSLSQKPVTPETSADFAEQFAADFDFVKTLDNNQVTLDLAAQYLQLGEYDSAKRLLKEVIVQGNHEQQSQAQELLARTA